MTTHRHLRGTAPVLALAALGAALLLPAPARAQRNANPVPAGPVPPITAITRLTRTPRNQPKAAHHRPADQAPSPPPQAQSASSASAVLRRTPRATRKASEPHSASRSSNSRRSSATPVSRAASLSAVRPSWARTSSCIPIRSPYKMPDAVVRELVQPRIKSIMNFRASYKHP